MRKLIFSFILFYSTISYAATDTEMYAVEETNGTIAIVHYVVGSNDSLEKVLSDTGLLGKPIKKISKTDLPDRKDRDFWKLNDVPIGKKIIVDQTKKQADEAAKAAKESRKKALLKLTDAEYQEAKDLGLVK